MPDSLLILPGHGAGSACGKSLGAVPVTTLGYERKTNWALLASSEDAFVKEVLEGQPEPPYYFKEMKRLNKEGPRVIKHITSPDHLEMPIGELLDIRPVEAIRMGHIPGALAIPFSPSFLTRAGWLLSYDSSVTIIANTVDEALAAKEALAMIGLDIVGGWMSPEDLHTPVYRMAQLTIDEVRPDDYLLDVRNASEWNSGHLNGARHIPLGYLRLQIERLPRDKRIVTYCQAGGRSAVAFSVLQREGFANVAELKGGIDAVSPEQLVSSG